MSVKTYKYYGNMIKSPQTPLTPQGSFGLKRCLRCFRESELHLEPNVRDPNAEIWDTGPE